MPPVNVVSRSQQTQAPSLQAVNILKRRNARTRIVKKTRFYIMQAALWQYSRSLVTPIRPEINLMVVSSKQHHSLQKGRYKQRRHAHRVDLDCNRIEKLVRLFACPLGVQVVARYLIGERW